MNTGKRRTIRKKVAQLILAVSLATVLLLGLATGVGLVNIRQDTVDSLGELNSQTSEDATDTLREQLQEELVTLVENRGAQADTSLELILNQTRLVAMAAQDIYSEPEQYLEGLSPDELSFDAYDLSCNYPEEVLGSFSFHIRIPRSIMAEDSIVEEDGTVVSAQLDLGALTQEQRTEYYLTKYLRGVLGGIRNFDNGDGTYTGIGASYFCLESSGIDVLADTLTMDMVEYDARESTWYTEASKLPEGGIYWTNPTPDASGRGLSLICAMPVYVDGELVGVAGSGGDINNIRELVQGTTIGETGYAVLVNTAVEGRLNIIASADTDETSELNSCHDDLFKTDNAELLAVLEKIADKQSGIEQIMLDGAECYIAYSPMSVTEWTMVTVIEVDDASISGPIEALRENADSITAETITAMSGKLGIIALFFLLVAVVVTALVIAASYKFSHRLAQPLALLTDGAKRISGGDLDFNIEVRSGDEAEELGDAFNHMTASLKEYIENLSRVTAEKERIGAELHVATQIQASMLPCIFPAFPERSEFDIYASMTPAKEVGGDFYDFFLVDDDHLALVIADVSGKGVPAALFMVIAKTLLKNRAQMGAGPKEVLEVVNDQLCESNEAEMFVTVWLGIYEISTGKLRAANAGHEYPAIRRKDGSFELYKDRHGFVLAGMQGMKYREYELQLDDGDELFVYTDGVTEATDAAEQLYGTDRLLAALNSAGDCEPEELLMAVKADIDRFVAEAPQFDDITMLSLKRRGISAGDELTLEAKVENIEKATAFVEERLERLDCSIKSKTQLAIAIDEIMSNIARYAYAPGTGEATLRFEHGDGAVTLTFIDRGVPYDPLAKPDPDTTLSAEEREIGGLGIYMVKKSMDDCGYEYRDGQNIFWIKKRL